MTRPSDGHPWFSGCRIALLALSLSALVACSGDAPAIRRGPFAFHYAPALNEEQLAWYSGFDILVTHDPLPADQVRHLRDAGTSLLLYEWAVAFYETRATPWQRSLLADSKSSLLNDTALIGGAGSDTAPAWYFDPASAEHTFGRADEIARRLQTIGYDGVFLDTTTIESVHPAAQREYTSRHPDLPYDAAFARFLSQLRKRLAGRIIFTNQGYRSPDHYLPYVDWDLTESLITRPAGNSYALRPWNDSDDPWNSTHYLMRNLIAPVAARYPEVRFGHLNYVHDHDREVIRLIVAVSQLFDGEGFAAAPSLHGELDSIYFREPGHPLSDRVDSTDGSSSYRFFHNGLIAVTAASRPVTIDTSGWTGFRNHITGELLCDDSITLPAAGKSPRAFFFDRTSECDWRR